MPSCGGRRAGLAAACLALLLALTASVPAVVFGASRAATKVVVIVGPAGAVTADYRTLGESAARAALSFTSNVVRVYSPDATWPAVRSALDGASIVVYLGHGNGWPSRYSHSLNPSSQNGFGLNPVAGEGDDAHQYFGEARIAAEVHLARNAVVILGHLCYASGASEPGLAQGSVDEAKQRVDNYASGFIRAGAAAVIAEAETAPAWFVRAILSGSRPVDAIWRNAPSAHAHEIPFTSSRSAGYTAVLDPDHSAGGFYRSIVYRAGISAVSVRAGDGASATAPHPTPVASKALRSLAGAGLFLGTPELIGGLHASASVQVRVPYEVADASVLAGLMVAAQWDPLGDGATPANPPAGQGEQQASAGPVQLVVPEQPSSLVEPIPATIGPAGIVIDVPTPEAAGRYRLVMTLHDSAGVGYDASTQRLLPTLVVRVGRDSDAVYIVTPEVAADPGTVFSLSVGVANLGTSAWGYEPAAGSTSGINDPASSAVVVGKWVPLTTAEGSAQVDPQARLRPGVEPGSISWVVIAGSAPLEPGSYLLVLDTVVPGVGSLSATGVQPAFVRVTVGPSGHDSDPTGPKNRSVPPRAAL